MHEDGDSLLLVLNPTNMSSWLVFLIFTLTSTFAYKVPLTHVLSPREPVSRTLQSTWQNPSDTLSILLIIGGDIVLQALAQLTGRSITPVAFSFGWVAYSFYTLKSVAGDGRLLPPPDYPVKVINASNGYRRDNKSWALSRLFRDFEHPLPEDVGLSVTVFEAVEGKEPAGVPSIDRCWISGFVVIAIQFGIAAIPCGLHGNWGILLVTAVATGLSLVTGMLPQWRVEKWACRRHSKKVVGLTGGNGSRHVMVIIGKGHGLDLEDLAAAESPRLARRRGTEPRIIRGLPLTFWVTRAACLTLALLWIIFLITVTALEEDAWYLLAVGGIGMVQNVIIAGARRDLGTSGIHLEEIEVFRQRTVMDTLMDLESAYKHVGKSLLAEFFPDGLRTAEKEWWAGNRKAYQQAREAERFDSLLPVDVSERARRAREEHSSPVK
ncbi:hypothetical protein V5O48_002022 [Marasmius crinis-equi]|uniref:Uncharacterized protein n=1 Tax=Marasmius crinis-equi TaxID=585013 RepID=A0ABR3FXM9_9AGAR